MNKEKKSRLCPYKKIIEQSYNGLTGAYTTNERFAPCAGERCMAYNSGKCRRLEAENGGT